MCIGQRIRHRREQLNIGQSDLAKIVHVSKQTLYKYENGIVTNIPSDKIEDLAKALSCNPAYLMGWDSDAKAIAADADWFETGLSLLGWEEKEEERDNAKYETTLSNGKESVRVSADDIECMTNALKMYLLNMLTGSKRANNASLDLSDEESLLLQGFHAMGEESQRYLLMMARDALGAKSSGSAMSSTSRADEVSA